MLSGREWLFVFAHVWGSSVCWTCAKGLSEGYHVTNLTVCVVQRYSVSKASDGRRGHRAMPLVLRSGKQKSEFEGSSQLSGSPVSAAASGFLLMTKSRLSPASIIRGTVRQQSKSLVLTRFTWKIANEIIQQATAFTVLWRNCFTFWEIYLLLWVSFIGKT